MSQMLLALDDVSKSYGKAGSSRHRVLEEVSFDIHAGEAVGLSGRSGAGKSTLARIILGLEPTDGGEVLFMGRQINFMTAKQQRDHFRNIQIIWQDPSAYLNPYQGVLTAIAEPMAAFGIHPPAVRLEMARDLMKRMGLPPSLEKYKPAKLSGGQCQRVAIARALSVSPKLLICDEALVSLDLPQQVAMLKLLKDLQQSDGLSILFISHDMDTVNKICHRVYDLAHRKYH